MVKEKEVKEKAPRRKKIDKYEDLQFLLETLIEDGYELDVNLEELLELTNKTIEQLDRAANRVGPKKPSFKKFIKKFFEILTETSLPLTAQEIYYRMIEQEFVDDEIEEDVYKLIYEVEKVSEDVVEVTIRETDGEQAKEYFLRQ